MTEYIKNPLSGKLRGVTYEDGKIIDVHIRDTDDVVKVFVPVRHGKWIPVTERLPENETDVLIAYTRKGYRGYSYSGVCTAFHTDGHTSTEDSSYNWEIGYVDMDYDEEADAYIVPEGWWETVDFGEEFSSVDADVTHWMPMPEPPKEETP